MSNIKYLTLEGLSLFKTKIDTAFASHLTGDRTSEGVNIVLRNNVPTDNTYAVLDSVSIPSVNESYAGVMTPDQLTRLNASATAAFSSIIVGSTTITASSVADTVAFTGGSGIDVSAQVDADNKTITISHADTSTVATTAVGPNENKIQTVEDDLQFTVPEITVDDFGHVTVLTGRTITVKDTNTKTTEDGHYEPNGTDGEISPLEGNNVTTFDNTITFVQSVTVDSKKHLTGATFGSLKLTETTLSKGNDKNTGNGVSDISVNGHQITLTKTNFATPDDVTDALTSAKEYADSLELRKFDFKGDLPSTATTAVVGDVYRIATAGDYFGETYEVGDFVLCVTPGTTANTDAACWASLNTNWSVSNSAATLTSNSAQTLAQVGGVDITVNVPDFSLNGHTHPDLAKDEHSHTLNHTVDDDDIVNLSITSDSTTLGKSAAGFTLTANHKTYDSKSIIPTGSLNWGQTISIPSVSSDGYGHINGGELVPFTMPDNPNTDTTVTSVDNHYKKEGYKAASSGLYKITTDAAGHVTSQTDVVKDDITNLGIPAQDTTYGASNPITLSKDNKFGLSYLDETSTSNTISSTTYATYNKLGITNNKLCAVIENITTEDIDKLFLPATE